MPDTVKMLAMLAGAGSVGEKFFAAATAASAAASYWMGPSTSSSGALSRTKAVAARTFSTSAPDPDSPGTWNEYRGGYPDWERAQDARAARLAGRAAAAALGR